MTERLDPFEVAALEKSLNDSATRVSTIWVSFLIFALYLLIAAATVEHRQLFLAEPVKLPVLNIELPLWGFFFLAPILFVIFHGYVLLQVLLLGRTAAAYNDAVTKAVERDGLAPEENASLRQRLANTLFAQIFAGSPREREGWLGFLLKAMAWITLAFAPIAILAVFQYRFLPYHDHFVTWTHRVLILVELMALFLFWPLVLDARRDFEWPNVWTRLKRAALFLFWPLVLDARRDFEWPNVWTRLKRAAVLPRRLLGPRDGRREEWLWLRQQAAPLAACLLFVLFSLSFATFPGEWHVNLFTGKPLTSVQCQRWFSKTSLGLEEAARNWQNDRLVLRRLDVVDDEKLKRIEEATKAAGEQPHQGERTRYLRGRNFNCGDFSEFTDLRRVDLAGAHLTSANLWRTKLHGANLFRAKLPGASLDNAQLQGAFLERVQLQGASLKGAQLQDANLFRAELQGASLNGAQFQGAMLNGAQLQGASADGAKFQSASLNGAQFQGANLVRAEFQGASLDGAKLQGADLLGAQLQGASLADVELQGASLLGAQLQGASLDRAQLQGTTLRGAALQGASLAEVQLQGASLADSSMKLARFVAPHVWRAREANCNESLVHRPSTNAVISADDAVKAEPREIAEFIERSVADIPGEGRKQAARTRMRAGLVVDPAKDDTADIAKVWGDCEGALRDPKRAAFYQNFDNSHADFLRDLVCGNAESGKAVAKGIIRKWISDAAERRDFSFRLARGLLGLDGKPCAETKDLDETALQRLRAAAAWKPPPASAAQ